MSRQPNRTFAHHLADELPPPLPPLVRDTWRDHARDALEIVAGTVVLGALFFGIPFVLWLFAGGQV